jgi:hypothetical protein
MALTFAVALPETDEAEDVNATSPLVPYPIQIFVLHIQIVTDSAERQVSP